MAETTKTNSNSSSTATTTTTPTPTTTSCTLSSADRELVARARAIIKARYRPDWHVVGAALRLAKANTGSSSNDAVNTDTTDTDTNTPPIVTGVHLDANVGRIAVCAEAVALGRALVEYNSTNIDTIVAVYHTGDIDNDSRHHNNHHEGDHDDDDHDDDDDETSRKVRRGGKGREETDAEHDDDENSNRNHIYNNSSSNNDDNKIIPVVSPCGMCREMISDYAPDAMVIMPMECSRQADGDDGTEESLTKVSIRKLLPGKYSR